MVMLVIVKCCLFDFECVELDVMFVDDVVVWMFVLCVIVCIVNKVCVICSVVGDL